MEKSYYDILEINKNASPEIIEKAYKTLAKKYHPDLQPTKNKKEAEETLKKINEAYEILSNQEKKLIYDKNLKSKDISEEDYNALYNKNKTLTNELNNIKKKYSQNSNIINNQNTIRQQSNYTTPNNIQKNTNQNILEEELLYKQELEKAKKQAYYDAYIQDLKNRGYKIKYKKSFKDYFKNLIALIITVAILFLLWQIPFINKFFINIINNNYILKYLFDLFNN